MLSSARPPLCYLSCWILITTFMLRVWLSFSPKMAHMKSWNQKDIFADNLKSWLSLTIWYLFLSGYFEFVIPHFLETSTYVISFVASSTGPCSWQAFDKCWLNAVSFWMEKIAGWILMHMADICWMSLCSRQQLSSFRAILLEWECDTSGYQVTI